MKRRFLIAVSLLLAVGSQAGWIEDRADHTVIHIKLDLPDPHRTDTPSRADLAAIQSFVRRFPEMFAHRYRDEYQAHPERYGRHNWERVEIELHRQTGIKVEGVESALLAIAGGLAPDIMYVNFRQSDTYIQQGFLYPLDRPEDDYLSGMSEEEIDFRVHPKIWPVIRRRGPGGREHVWAIPRGGALGKVLLYRKDLFDQAGLEYPDETWTWDDLLHACREITDPARGIYGMRFSRGKDESYHWMNFLWSAGGEAVVYDEEEDQWRAVFDSPEAAVALDFYTRLNTEPWVDDEGKQRYGYVYKDPTNAKYKWGRGEIAMWFWYIDEKLFATFNPEVTGMAPVPKGPTGIRGAELNSRMMGLFAGIEHPAVRDAAWAFIRYYDSVESWRIRTRVMVEGGFGRFINPRYLRLFGYDEILRLAPKGWSDIFQIAIATGHPEPYCRNCNYAYDIMTEPLQRAEEAALRGELPQEREARLRELRRMLARANAEANEKMLGIVSPTERTRRRITAAVALVIIVFAFGYVFRRAVTVFKPAAAPGEKRSGWEFRKYRVAYLLLLPAVLTILLWQYLPLAWGSVMAFQHYKIMGGSTWVWLDNFGDVLWSGDWWQAVWNSLRYSFLVIALTFLPPVILAILLQEVPRGKILFRTIYYLPGMITGLVVILLWKAFCEPSEHGVLPSFIWPWGWGCCWSAFRSRAGFFITIGAGRRWRWAEPGGCCFTPATRSCTRYSRRRRPPFSAPCS